MFKFSMDKDRFYEQSGIDVIKPTSPHNFSKTHFSYYEFLNPNQEFYDFLYHIFISSCEFWSDNFPPFIVLLQKPTAFREPFIPFFNTRFFYGILGEWRFIYIEKYSHKNSQT